MSHGLLEEVVCLSWSSRGGCFPLVVFWRRLFVSRGLLEGVVCLSMSSEGGCLSLMVFWRRLFVSRGLMEEVVCLSMSSGGGCLPLVVFRRRLFVSHDLLEEVVCLSWSSGGSCLSLMVFMRRLFVSHGLPEEVVSDNGSQFTGHEFKTFLEMNGIKHTRVAPYHPASSGATERCVQTVKQRPRKHAAGIHISKEHWVVNFLLRYRCTPHSVTGVSPAELFLKRRLRNRFSLLKSHMTKDMEEKQQKQKICANWSKET